MSDSSTTAIVESTRIAEFRLKASITRAATAAQHSGNAGKRERRQHALGWARLLVSTASAPVTSACAAATSAVDARQDCPTRSSSASAASTPIGRSEEGRIDLEEQRAGFDDLIVADREV